MTDFQSFLERVKSMFETETVKIINLIETRDTYSFTLKNSNGFILREVSVNKNTFKSNADYFVLSFQNLLDIRKGYYFYFRNQEIDSELVWIATQQTVNFYIGKPMECIDCAGNKVLIKEELDTLWLISLDDYRLLNFSKKKCFDESLKKDDKKKLRSEIIRCANSIIEDSRWNSETRLQFLPNIYMLINSKLKTKQDNRIFFDKVI